METSSGAISLIVFVFIKSTIFSVHGGFHAVDFEVRLLSTKMEPAQQQKRDQKKGKCIKGRKQSEKHRYRSHNKYNTLQEEIKTELKTVR